VRAYMRALTYVCVHYTAIYIFFFALAAMIVTCEADQKTIERNNIIMNI